jgi:hypothetical protein
MRERIEDADERNKVGFAKIVLIILGIIAYAFITYLVLRIISSMTG